MTAAAVACIVVGAVFFGISVATGSVTALYVSAAGALVALLFLAAAVIQYRRQTAEPHRDDR